MTEILFYMYTYIYIILQFNVYNMILYDLFVYNTIYYYNKYVLSDEGRLIVTIRSLI